VGEVDAGADDGAQAGVALDLADEGAVELDGVAGDRVQVAEGGVAGAEVVDEDLEALGAQLAELADGEFLARDEGAFGDFELEGAGRQAVAFDAGDDLVGEVHLHELAGREVDADRQVFVGEARSRQDLRRAQLWSSICMPSSWTRSRDSATGMKTSGRSAGRWPGASGPGLRSRWPAGLEIDDGLEVGDQLVVAQGGAELGFELQVAHDLLVHGRLEDGDGVSALRRERCMALSASRMRSSALEAAAAQGDADARLGVEDVAVEFGVLGQVGLQVFGETDGFAGVGMSLSSTANWSPPMRPTTSPGRARARMRARRGAAGRRRRSSRGCR
jgi:hypothetical protein